MLLVMIINVNASVKKAGYKVLPGRLNKVLVNRELVLAVPHIRAVVHRRPVVSKSHNTQVVLILEVESNS